MRHDYLGSRAHAHTQINVCYQIRIQLMKIDGSIERQCVPIAIGPNSIASPHSHEHIKCINSCQKLSIPDWIENALLLENAWAEERGREIGTTNRTYFTIFMFSILTFSNKFFVVVVVSNSWEMISDMFCVYVSKSNYVRTYSIGAISNNMLNLSARFMWMAYNISI